MRATVLAIADELTEDGLVLRYKVDTTDTGFEGKEGTFTICSFWLVTALAMIGEQERARALCQKLLAFAGPLQLYAEEIDAATGEHLGNFPQAFTHLALIDAVGRLIEAERRAGRGLVRGLSGPLHSTEHNDRRRHHGVRRSIDGRALRRHHHRHGRRRRHAGAHPGTRRVSASSCSSAAISCPREKENWDPSRVFVKNRYISAETWRDGNGTTFQPQVHYFVGGATKMYGASLYRLRPQDFGELRHVDGISPAWPLSYDDFEPYYTKAEWLYQVHGTHGEDPTEGFASKPYPWPAVSHEPRIEQLASDLKAAGYHPFHAPCGIQLDEANRPRSTCIRCPGATAIRVWFMRSPMPKCSRCARFSRSRTSRCWSRAG